MALLQIHQLPWRLAHMQLIAMAHRDILVSAMTSESVSRPPWQIRIVSQITMANMEYSTQLSCAFLENSFPELSHPLQY